MSYLSFGVVSERMHSLGLLSCIAGLLLLLFEFCLF
jgi:hypothetical protein